VMRKVGAQTLKWIEDVIVQFTSTLNVQRGVCCTKKYKERQKSSTSPAEINRTRGGGDPDTGRMF